MNWLLHDIGEEKNHTTKVNRIKCERMRVKVCVIELNVRIMRIDDHASALKYSRWISLAFDNRNTSTKTKFCWILICATLSVVFVVAVFIVHTLRILWRKCVISTEDNSMQNIHVAVYRFTKKILFTANQCYVGRGTRRWISSN